MKNKNNSGNFFVLFLSFGVSALSGVLHGAQEHQPCLDGYGRSSQSKIEPTDDGQPADGQAVALDVMSEQPAGITRAQVRELFANAEQELAEKAGVRIALQTGIEIRRALAQKEVVAHDPFLGEASRQELAQWGAVPAEVTTELGMLAAEHDQAYQAWADYYKEKNAVRVTGARAHGCFEWHPEQDKVYRQLEQAVVVRLVSNIVKKKRAAVEGIEAQTRQVRAKIDQECEARKKCLNNYGPYMCFLFSVEVLAFIGSLIYIGIHPDTCGSK